MVSKYLTKGKHYEVVVKDMKIELTTDGYKYCEQLLGKSLFDLADPWAFYLINALKAKELFSKDKEYVVLDGGAGASTIGIVDSFSGRVLDGRRFTDGRYVA